MINCISDRCMHATGLPEAAQWITSYRSPRSVRSSCATSKPLPFCVKRHKLVALCAEMNASSVLDAPTKPDKVNSSTHVLVDQYNVTVLCEDTLELVQITNQTRWVRPQSRWLPFRYRECLWTTSIRRSTEPSELPVATSQLTGSRIGKVDELLARGDTGEKHVRRCFLTQQQNQ